MTVYVCECTKCRNDWMLSSIEAKKVVKLSEDEGEFVWGNKLDSVLKISVKNPEKRV